MSAPNGSIAPAQRNGSEPSAPALTLTVELTAEQIDAIASRAAELVTAQQAPATSPWLNVAEAAERLRCGKDRVYDLIALGKLEPRRDGRRVLLRVDDVDAYLESSR
ncbi:MAG: helix-turn-helix domain-containing protein [Solirubrobacteraceae bacterium]